MGIALAYQEYLKAVLSEITYTLEAIEEESLLHLISMIDCANTIVVCGAGRVGLAVRGFGMRLGHLGYRAYTLGDSVVPHIKEGDLLIVASGSGETQTIYDVVKNAKGNGAKGALISGRVGSRIYRLSDHLVLMKSPSKISSERTSIQPMTTLNEQCVQILFDLVVLMIMERTNQTHEDMWTRHSNLE